MRIVAGKHLKNTENRKELSAKNAATKPTIGRRKESNGNVKNVPIEQL